MGIYNVRIFGSVRRKEDHIGSDLDLMFDYDRKVYNYKCRSMLALELARILNCKIDLIPADYLIPGIFDEEKENAQKILDNGE